MKDKKCYPCSCSVERKIASRVSELYRYASLIDFPEEVTAPVLAFIASPGAGLLISGPVGTGKTHLGAAIVRAAIEDGKDASLESYEDFYSNLREACRIGASEKTVVACLETAWFLVMDDLGAGSLSDYERRSALYLLNRRLNKMRPTIVTTNWNLPKISECMDDRIASRLASFTYLQLTGADRRVTNRSANDGSR